MMFLVEWVKEYNVEKGDEVMIWMSGKGMLMVFFELVNIEDLKVMICVDSLNVEVFECVIVV